MIITLQYTLTDLRKFDDSFHLLSYPNWPQPKPYTEFVRGNGQIVPSDRYIATKLGYTSITENRICKIKRGIKMARRRFVNDLGLNIENKSKYYFSDGTALVKYEFTFRINTDKREFSHDDLKGILNYLLGMPLLIRNKEYQYTEYRFKNLFRGLIELHKISTTPHENPDIVPRYAIISCTPQIFVTFNSRQSYTYRPRTKMTVPVKDSNGSVVFGQWYEHNSHPYKLWIFHNKGGANNSSLFSLKSGILRIHSEKECINNVIQAVIDGHLKAAPGTAQSNLLSDYLNRKICDLGPNYKKISALDGSGVQIERFIKNVYHQDEPGEISAFIEKLETLHLRRQVGIKLEDYVKKNPEIFKNPVIIMDNSQKISISGSTIHGDVSQNQQNNQQVTQMNFESVYDGIDTLLKHLQTEPDSYNKEVAVNNLQEAKAATVKKDEKGVVKALKSAGKWTWDFATKVGVSVVSEIVKQHIK